MLKNVASQTLTMSVFDSATGLQKTGDASNLLIYVDKDDGGPNAITANSGVPTEIDNVKSKGDYKIALSQAETNADKLHFTGKSVTSGIVVVSKTIYTLPTAGLASPTNITAGVITTVTGNVQGNVEGSVLTNVEGDLLGKVIGQGASNIEAVGVWSDVQTIKTQTVTCAASVTVSPFVGSTGAAVNGTNNNAVTLAAINAEADTALADYGALQPTTAGRKLDVTTGGAAGIDWGNIENKGTTNDLSSTSISYASAVLAVVGDVTGNIGGSLIGDVQGVVQTDVTLSSGTENAIADALLDRTSGIETGKTLRQALRLIAAALAGKRSNSGTGTEQFDAVGNPGTARIVGNLDAAGDGTPTLTP